MIIWIASYPKSGNTWIRALLSAYLFSEDGKFSFNLLKNIEQFSSKYFLSNIKDNLNYQERISKNWIPFQKEINKDKKIHLFKTHNAICSINGHKFTDKLNTIGGIYIVRDPRNLILSISHHYGLNFEEAYNFLTNKRKIIFPVNHEKKEQKVPEDFNFLGDWSSHYQSWKNVNFCPIKIIKYEDILIDDKKIFISILEFLSKFFKIQLNKKKISNAINSTSFQKLSQMEDEEGFEESVFLKKVNKKIKFFNLGKKNNWKKSLDDITIKKVENSFRNDMKELNYL